ncbi:MAG: hypothetical protein ABIT37_17760 [Luteolibacter sp.]
MFCLAPAMLMAQEPVPLARKKIPAISMLPDGSQLMGVMLPRYDVNHKRVGVLKAKKMILVNDEQIAGETVSVEFFNPDQTPRGRVDLKKAIFYQMKGILEAKEPVEISADRLNARGSGLYYAFDQAEGYLSGPVTTTIHPLPATSMNTPRNPLRATAMVGMSLLTQSLIAAPPVAVFEQKEATQADAVSKSAAAAEAGAATRKELKTVIEVSQAADTAAQAFLVQGDIPVPAADPQPVANPLDVKPGAEDTVIKCDGGMYFDADEGVLVYLKNVTVTDPRLELTGANELKIFFGKKPEDPSKKEKQDPSKSGFGSVGANFNEVERIVATGAVRAIQKKPADGEQPVEASGAIFTYNVKADQMIIYGGFPWAKRGGITVRAKTAAQTLKVSKSGQFSFDGPTETILPTDELKH